MAEAVTTPLLAVSSARTRMGATLFDGGVTLRVWQKFADRVSVIGAFNGWNTESHYLARDGDSDYFSVDVVGATIGQPYKFCLHINGRKLFKIDPYAASLEQKEGVVNGVIAAHNEPYDGGSFKTPSWNEAVIYELHIPTFTTLRGGSHGDFNSASGQLALLADLGINAIELLLLGQFAGIQSTGYNPGDIFAVEDSFGGPDGFRRFVNQAHKLGIAVIVDVVYNHLDDTDLQQFEGWSEPNKCPYDEYDTNGGIYFYQDRRAHTNFSHLRFDLGRTEVAQYVFDSATRWLEQRFVDGLRFDSTMNIRAIQVNGKNYGDVPEGGDLLGRINQHIQQN